MIKVNKKIINIGIALFLCILFFSPILELLQLCYLVPEIIPMGLTYKLQRMVDASVMLIFFFDFVMGVLYVSTREKWYRDWTYVVTFLLFGCGFAYAFIAPIVIAGSFYLIIVMAIVLFALLAIVSSCNPKIEKQHGQVGKE